MCLKTQAIILATILQRTNLGEKEEQTIDQKYYATQ